MNLFNKDLGMHAELKKINESVVKGAIEDIGSIIIDVLDKKFSAEQILNESMIPAMDEVGRLYEQGVYFLPEMLLAAQTMQAGVTVLKPYLVEGDLASRGKIAIGTVKGDLHDIGKNLVALMLEGAGYEVHDLGVDVPPGKFIEAIESGVDMIGFSSLLTTTLIQMEKTVQIIEDKGLRDEVKVIIGGAIATSKFSDQIGADGYAPDASSAVKLVRKLSGER